MNEKVSKEKVKPGLGMSKPKLIMRQRHELIRQGSPAACNSRDHSSSVHVRPTDKMLSSAKHLE